MTVMNEKVMSSKCEEWESMYVMCLYMCLAMTIWMTADSIKHNVYERERREQTK
jgi:hypothetical protein